MTDAAKAVPTKENPYPDVSLMDPATLQYEFDVLRYGNSQGRMWLGELNAIRWAWDKQMAQWKKSAEEDPERWNAETFIDAVEFFGNMFIKPEVDEDDDLDEDSDDASKVS